MIWEVQTRCQMPQREKIKLKCKQLFSYKHPSDNPLRSGAIFMNEINGNLKLIGIC